MTDEGERTPFPERTSELHRDHDQFAEFVSRVLGLTVDLGQQ
jgi:hypothetical protein